MQVFEKLIPGKYYHLYNRGNNRENLFKEDRNYYYFLDLWQKHVNSVADTFAYCLMKNHFHFLVRVKDEEEIIKLIFKKRAQTPSGFGSASPGNPDGVPGQEEILKRIKNNIANHFNAYTQGINRAYNRSGKLFEAPFERKEVNSEDYFRKLVYYIHFNPQKHGFVKDFRDWKFSSYHSFINDEQTFIQREKMISWFNSAGHFISFHNVEQVEKGIETLIQGDD